MEQTDFERLESRAADYLDSVTYQRAQEHAQESCVKNACCALADAMLLNEKGGGVASEKNDGVEVDYVVGVSISKTSDQRLYDTAKQYLGLSGLMYRGMEYAVCE